MPWVNSYFTRCKMYPTVDATTAILEKGAMPSVTTKQSATKEAVIIFPAQL